MSSPQPTRERLDPRLVPHEEAQVDPLSRQETGADEVGEGDEEGFGIEQTLVEAAGVGEGEVGREGFCEADVLGVEAVEDRPHADAWVHVAEDLGEWPGDRRQGRGAAEGGALEPMVEASPPGRGLGVAVVGPEVAQVGYPGKPRRPSRPGTRPRARTAAATW